MLVHPRHPVRLVPAAPIDDLTQLEHRPTVRDLEREADDYALAYMGRNDIDPERLAQLLLRLEETAGESFLPIPFLSSHPATEERIERLRSGA